ncbi:hypothetical protein Bca101_026674 [Brassica carinata]
MGMTKGGEIPKSSKVPKKDLMSTSGEGESGSSCQAKGRKDKEIMREDPIEEESSHGSESEEEPLLKRKKRAPKPPKKPPPPSEIARLLKAMTFMPTAYPEPVMLQSMGLYEDVRFLLGKMGLESLLTLQRPGYMTATYQFLSTLDAKFYSKEDADDGYGFITFKAGRQTYRMSFKRISEVMGFPDRRDPRIGRADIRNPSLRYVQRILSSTLYARKDPERVVEDELKFLTLGLKDVIGEKWYNGTKVHYGAKVNPGIVGLFVKRLIHYQKWAWTKKDKEPKLSIGGFITPLLEAMEVPLPEADVGFVSMDESFLTNIGFLGGRVGNSWIYCFKVVKEQNKYVRTFLPNQGLTSVAERNNIKFRVPQEALSLQMILWMMMGPRLWMSRFMLIGIHIMGMPVPLKCIMRNHVLLSASLVSAEQEGKDIQSQPYLQMNQAMKHFNHRDQMTPAKWCTQPQVTTAEKSCPRPSREENIFHLRVSRVSTAG